MSFWAFITPAHSHSFSCLMYLKDIKIIWIINTNTGIINLNFLVILSYILFEWSLINFYKSNRGLLNWGSLACCRKQAKSKNSVQIYHLSHTIRFLLDLSRRLCFILIGTIGRFHLYRETIITDQHKKNYMRRYRHIISIFWACYKKLT